ncbi:MAG: hypothetical protein ACYC4D_04525 [Thermoleophilia bacterium]
MGDETATIEVMASHMKGSVAQDLVKPTIEVDGEPREGNWGLNTLVVSPGQHTIKAYHKWLVFRKAYASSTTVEVAAGQTVSLEWHTGSAAFRPGKWKVL